MLTELQNDDFTPWPPVSAQLLIPFSPPPFLTSSRRRRPRARHPRITGRRPAGDRADTSASGRTHLGARASTGRTKAAGACSSARPWWPWRRRATLCARGRGGAREVWRCRRGGRSAHRGSAWAEGGASAAAAGMLPGAPAALLRLIRREGARPGMGAAAEVKRGGDEAQGVYNRTGKAGDGRGGAPAVALLGCPSRKKGRGRSMGAPGSG
jgi:hypothetical protein